jgi:hypothetical protein
MFDYTLSVSHVADNGDDLTFFATETHDNRPVMIRVSMGDWQSNWLSQQTSACRIYDADGLGLSIVPHLDAPGQATCDNG